LVAFRGCSRYFSCCAKSVAATAVVIRDATKEEISLSPQLGGGGELGCLQFANTSFEAVNASAEDGKFGFEFVEKATQFVA
jgi:hypothetical protein